MVPLGPSLNNNGKICLSHFLSHDNLRAGAKEIDKGYDFLTLGFFSQMLIVIGF